MTPIEQINFNEAYVQPSVSFRIKVWSKLCNHWLKTNVLQMNCLFPLKSYKNEHTSEAAGRCNVFVQKDWKFLGCNLPETAPISWYLESDDNFI